MARFRRIPVEHWEYGETEDRIRRRVIRATREEMELSSINELDADERAVLEKYVTMLATGRRDISWNGPYAQYLKMIGRRPIMQNVDVGETY